MVSNSVHVIGRLTRDPEARVVGDGIKVVNFAVAVQRPKSRNAEHPEADFFDVEAWRFTADFIEKYASKGSLIAVDGYLRVDKFEDKDNVTHRVTRIVADDVRLLDKREGTNNSENNTASDNNNAATKEDNGSDAYYVSDDMPF